MGSGRQSVHDFYQEEEEKMKKTRKSLIKWLEDLSYERLETEEFVEFVTNAGWVKLDEPREFWIFYNKEINCIRDCKGPNDPNQGFNEEIIHVREVIEE